MRERAYSLIEQSCHIDPMPKGPPRLSTKRPDVFDYIGIGLVALVAAMWIAHFALPAPPPEPPQPFIQAPHRAP
jgi:hypothetical protein